MSGWTIGSSQSARVSRGLRQQCAELGLPVSAIELPRTEAGWEVSGLTFRRPEPAALELLRAEGWIGACCEGGPMLLLIKSACFETLARLNQFGREAAVTHYLEGQFVVQAAHMSRLLNTIGHCESSKVLCNFEEIYRSRFINEIYPGVTSELIQELYRVLGDKLVQIAAKFAADPYLYRSGWPDITAVRGNQILLLEVKTRDRLHNSQISTIAELIVPAKIPCEVLQLVPARK